VLMLGTAQEASASMASLSLGFGIAGRCDIHMWNFTHSTTDLIGSVVIDYGIEVDVIDTILKDSDHPATLIFSGVPGQVEIDYDAPVDLSAGSNTTLDFM
jgi:hypothetical protein